MRWHTFESLARVLAAGVFGYFGYEMLVGHYPFGSGRPPSWMGPLFLGVAAYQVSRAWKVWQRKDGGLVEHAHPAEVEPATGQMDDELTRLRIAATSDPKAALALRTKLRKQLVESTAAAHEYKRRVGNDPTLPGHLEDVEKRHEALRLELAELEKTIRLRDYRG